MNVKTLPIYEIRVGKRYRKDLGDIASLAASIADVGLLHPVVVTPAGTLIAGQRRLLACRQLGWKDIPVHVVDLDVIVRGEFHENMSRKDFIPSEAVAIASAVRPMVTEMARERRRGGRGVKLPPEKRGRTRNIVASYVGMSGYTLEKAATIVEAAEEDPAKYGPLKEAMDRTGRVDGLFIRYKQLRDQEEVAGRRPRKGLYRTIVVDPPWDYRNVRPTAHLATPYKPMTHDELLALPVADWADERCHLYVWTTNNFVKEARELIDAWGFEHKTMLTWIKDRGSPGFYFLSTTEHVLFATRGKLRCKVQSVPTHFFARRGRHSTKPEEFYELVQKVSYSPFLDAFARRKRPGWSAWGKLDGKAHLAAG